MNNERGSGREREDLVEAIEGEGEDLGDVGLLGDGGQREEAGHRRRVLCGIFGLHRVVELRIDWNFRIGPSG